MKRRNFIKALMATMATVMVKVGIASEYTETWEVKKIEDERWSHTLNVKYRDGWHCSSQRIINSPELGGAQRDMLRKGSELVRRQWLDSHGTHQLLEDCMTERT